jgi:acetate kinase
MSRAVLTLNAGSSSLKTALYALDAEGAPVALAGGQVSGVGGDAPELSLKGADGARLAADALPAGLNHTGALDRIVDAVRAAFPGAEVAAVGHRVVHGGPDFAAPVRLDADILAALERLAPFAPLHQPHNLAAIRAAQARFPEAMQVACFDTAFHRGHPWEADVIALPRRYHARGVRRYGFHGLSYDYVSARLRALDPERASGRVIIAHLGAGASLCALQAGRSVDSTMGFSAIDGMPMATRTGRIDPGALLWLMENEGMGAAEISTLLYRESGLKGLSEDTGDMRALEASDDPRAEAALRYYAYRARQEIGGLTAALQGLDALVFTGGVGENSVAMRARICDGLGWLGVRLDPARNAAGEGPISADGSAVAVRVIRTDEEAVIAAAAALLI